MRRTWRTGILTLLIGLIVGAAIGAATGLWIWPVRFTDAEMSDLSPDDQDAFLLLAAEAFALNGDLSSAEGTVSLLGQPNSVEHVLAAADRLEAAGRTDDAELLRRLGQALAGQ